MTSNRVVGFIVVGVIAGAANVGARALLNTFFSYEVSVALAFPIALTIAFVLNRNFVFGATEGDTSTQYMKFALVNILALAQVWIVSVGLARWLFPAVGFTWHADLIAHTIGVVSPIATSFLAYVKFVFVDGTADTRASRRS